MTDDLPAKSTTFTAAGNDLLRERLIRSLEWELMKAIYYFGAPYDADKVARLRERIKQARSAS